MTAPAPAVAAAFAAFPDSARAVLRDLRDLIFELARETSTGPLTETLKWGQPAYLTEATRAGTTIRLGLTGSGRPAVFFHCGTTLIRDAREICPDTFTYEGNRAMVLPDMPDRADRAALSICLARALTYRRDKRKTPA